MADIFYRETGVSVAFASQMGVMGHTDPLAKSGTVWATTEDGFHWQRIYDLQDPMPRPNDILTELYEDYQMWKEQDEVNGDSTNSH